MANGEKLAPAELRVHISDVAVPVEEGLMMDWGFLLEGFSLIETLHATDLDTELKDAFMDAAFGSVEKRLRNHLHWLAYRDVTATMDRLSPYAGENAYNQFFNMFNAVPLLPRTGRFRILPGGIKEVNHIFLGGLHADRSTALSVLMQKMVYLYTLLHEEPEVIVFMKVKKDVIGKSYDSWFTMLSNVSRLMAYWSEYDEMGIQLTSWIGKTVQNICQILLDVVGGARKLRDRKGQRVDPSTFMVPIFFSDGLFSDKLSQPPYLHWMFFYYVTHIFEWAVKGGKLSCPLYTLYTGAFGVSKGTESIRRFCRVGRPRRCWGNIGKDFCCCADSCVDMRKIREDVKQKQECSFWAVFDRVFGGFDRVENLRTPK